MNISTLLYHRSNCLSVIHFSELDISYVNGFSDYLMKMLVFSLSNSTWIWNNLLYPNWHALNWLIIFPLAYQKPVYCPLISGTREYIDSIMHNGFRILLRCPSLLSWNFSVYFVYNSKWIFWGSTIKDFNLFIQISWKKHKCLFTRQVFLSHNNIHSMFSAKNLKMKVDVVKLIANSLGIMFLWIFIWFENKFCGNPYFVFEHVGQWPSPVKFCVLQKPQNLSSTEDNLD